MGSIKKNILITGLPGVGKTTIIRQIHDALEFLHPVGFYTAEIREGGDRKGFELIDFADRRQILSHIKVKSPFRVGKYGVDVPGFESFLGEIDFFGPETDLIIVDEIGKMECLSAEFRHLIVRILDSSKPVITVIALKGGGIIEEIKRRDDVSLFEVTVRNRNRLTSDITATFLGH